MDAAKRIALVALFLVCGWFAIKLALAAQSDAGHPNEKSAPYQGYFARVY